MCKSAVDQAFWPSNHDTSAQDKVLAESGCHFGDDCFACVCNRDCQNFDLSKHKVQLQFIVWELDERCLILILLATC